MSRESATGLSSEDGCARRITRSMSSWARVLSTAIDGRSAGGRAGRTANATESKDSWTTVIPGELAGLYAPNAAQGLDVFSGIGPCLVASQRITVIRKSVFKTCRDVVHLYSIQIRESKGPKYRSKSATGSTQRQAYITGSQSLRI